MDLAMLDRLLAEQIVAPLDGTLLNRSLPPCAAGEALPFCETIASWCYQQLAPRLPAGVRLDGVRVAEDDTLHADCTGPA
jgi:6-pyruvoyl-tetrahydropterin synthase